MGIRVLADNAPDAVFRFLDTTVSQRGREHWRWKYRLAATAEPTAFYWEEADGRVLGFVGMMRTSLHFATESHPAAWFVDWHVTPGDRGVGVGLGLLRKAEAAAGTLLTLQGSADTRAMLPRLGWQQADSPRTWTRPLSRRFIADWLGRRAPALRVASRFAARVFAPPLRALPPAKLLPYSLHTVTEFPAAYDDTWQMRKREFAPLMSRDRAYLNYFAAEFPEGGYRCQLLCAHDAPVGHLITRIDDDGDGFQRGRIVDLLWPRHDRELGRWLVQSAVWDLRERGADYLECLASVSDLADALARERFAARRVVPIWYHRLPATAAGPNHWYVTLLDCDRAYR